MTKALNEALSALKMLRAANTVPSVAEFLDAIEEDQKELRTEQAQSRGYALRPLDPSQPPIRSLKLSGKAIEIGHKPPNGWAIAVRLGRDPRRYVFGGMSQRDATNLGKQFMFKLGDYCQDEDADKQWNIFVLSAARRVDVRLRKIGGIDPPEMTIKGPTTADGHEHEWVWTGTYSNATPFPVWHMRCVCGWWALLANRAGEAGEWVGYDEAVHDMRLADGTPAPNGAAKEQIGTSPPSGTT